MFPTAQILALSTSFLPITSHHRPVKVTLLWFPDSPLLIEILFNRQGNVWTLGRDLVADGLACGSAGEGDIRFTPEPSDPLSLRMTLSSPSGQVCLRVNRKELAAFLEATLAEAPDADVPLANDHDIERLIDAYMF